MFEKHYTRIDCVRIRPLDSGPVVGTEDVGLIRGGLAIWAIGHCPGGPPLQPPPPPLHGAGL